MIRKPVDYIEISKTFRMNKGELERLHIYRNKTEWKVVKNKKNCGMGYCIVNFNRRQIYYHSIVWMLYNKKDIPANLEIDHINRNKIDNRIENLRAVTHKENLFNQDVFDNDYSNRGCVFDKTRNRYFVRIKIDGNTIYVTRVKNEDEARIIYKIAHENRKYYKDNKSFRKLVKEYYNNTLQGGLIYANSTL